MEKEKYNLPASKLNIEPEELPEKDFRSSFHWRVFKIIAEFVEGWEFLANLKKSVTIFGSAVCKEDSKWYQEAQKIGYLLAKDGFDVITGGGPGIMEAGNRGAWEANQEQKDHDGKIGDSIGLNIKLPNEQRINRYVDKSVAFNYFFTRKVMLSYYAQAYIYFPGGYGTMDEMFELLTLIQTKKVPKIPIILIGREFWDPMTSWIAKDLYEKFATISEEDMTLFKVVDSAEEAFAIIKSSPLRKSF
jgi:hypothetical protein